MATMRPYLQRIELKWFGFWLVGALCGVILMVGLNAVQPMSHDSAAPPIVRPAPAESSAPVGGRLGGMSNSDTVSQPNVSQGLNSGSVPVPSSTSPLPGKVDQGSRNSPVPATEIPSDQGIHGGPR